jgi:hypothetical protein
MICEVGNTVVASECTEEIAMLLVIWSDLLFPRVSSTHLALTLFSSLYSSLNDSFAAGNRLPSPPTFLPLFYFTSFFLSNSIPSSSCHLLGPLLLRPQPPPAPTQI